MNKELIGRKFFGAGMLYLAVLCFLSADFIIGRAPIASNLPVLAYLLGGIVALCAIGILVKPQTGASAALFIAVIILIFSFLIRYVPYFIRELTFEKVFWNINAFKTLALVGGSLIVSASFVRDLGKDAPGFILPDKTMRRLTTTGIVLLSFFLILSGFAHFRFIGFLTGFIPDYIPFHAFFAQFTGVALIAGGVGLLLPATRYWAALLTGIMIFAWFLLLHIPRFIADVNAQSDRLGLGESLVFAGILFVLAGMREREAS